MDQMKFMCARKHKFGLNLQAICDSEYRFLDLSIIFGGACSDLLAFEASPIRQRLGSDNFLAPGLCIFGDNAYVNRSFMATPFPNPGLDMEKDAYNFFHSQLRITIECTFGILTQRWGFLRKRAPFKYSVKKTIATVSCLCKLHNFLIDNGNTRAPNQHTAEDQLTLAMDGAVQLNDVGEEDDPRQGVADGALLVDELTAGGEHFDDDPGYVLRRRITQEYHPDMLPRHSMSIHVTNQNLRRPVRNLARNKSRA